MSKETYPMKRDLDGVYLRVERDGRWLSLCLTDLTESDRDAMVDGLEIVRVALVQPVGPRAADRVLGAVSWQEYDRATMQIVCAAMQLWLSGKLGEVECDA